MSERRRTYAVRPAPVPPEPEPAYPPSRPPAAPRGKRYGIHATQGSRLKGRYKRWRRLQHSGRA